MSADALPGLPEPFFDSRQHRLYPRFINAGQIEHGQWLRAIAEGVPVGTCRRCGDWLLPQRPHQVSNNRTDYEANCRNIDGCGWLCAIPNGRYLPGSTRLSERSKRGGATTS